MRNVLFLFLHPNSTSILPPEMRQSPDSARLLTLQESNDKGLFKISVGKNNNNSLLPGVMDCGKQNGRVHFSQDAWAGGAGAFTQNWAVGEQNTVSGHELFPDCLVGLKLNSGSVCLISTRPDPTHAWT